MEEQHCDTLDLTLLPFWQWSPQEAPSAEVDTGIPFDSIHRPQVAMDTVFRKSLFQRHTLQVSHTTLQPRVNPSEPTWVFIVLMLIVGLQCLYFRLRKLKIMSLLKAAGDIRAMDRLKRDSNLNLNYLWHPMGLLVVAPIVLLVQRMLLPDTGFLFGILLVAAADVLYIVRNGILRMLGNTFENKQGVNLYITSSYIYHEIEGLVVVTLLFLFFYLPGARMTMFFIIVGFLAVAFVIRFLRSIKVFLTIPNHSSFYLFYYLCIVEILPLMVLAKWFIVQ